VLNPEWGRDFKPISPEQKKRMYALSLADSKQWTTAALASRYGIQQDRIVAMLELEKMEEDALKAGTCALDSPGLVDSRIPPHVWEQTAEIQQENGMGNAHDVQDTSVGSKQLQFQLSHEGVTREHVLKALGHLDSVAPEKVAAAPLEPKPIDPLISANVSASPDSPTTRFKWVFTDKKDNEVFLTRDHDGKAELHSRVPPAPKRFQKKRT